MSEARISHEYLERYAQSLVNDRDEAAEQALKFPRDSVEGVLYNERVRSFQLALTYLHSWSHGNYGQTLDQQRTESGDVP
jgi:hypothetical protein